MKRARVKCFFFYNESFSPFFSITYFKQTLKIKYEMKSRKKYDFA